MGPHHPLPRVRECCRRAIPLTGCPQHVFPRDTWLIAIRTISPPPPPASTVVVASVPLSPFEKICPPVGENAPMTLVAKRPCITRKISGRIKAYLGSPTDVPQDVSQVREHGVQTGAW